MKTTATMHRRRFLQVSAAGGGSLVVGFSLWGCKRPERDQKSQETPNPAAKVTATETALPAGESADFNAWVRIDPDDTVTFVIDKVEMGQGVLTSLAMILAEELDADWSKVRSEHAPPDESKYGMQITGGSTSVRMGFETLRKAGAAARSMLVAAAAKRWGVAADECRTENAVVVHERSDKRARYGELLRDAAAQTPPEMPKLKEQKHFRIIGKPVKRLDTRAKVDGSAIFGLDVKRPGLLTAQVEHGPLVGGQVKSFESSAAKQVPGVREVVQIPTGVAVVGDHFWAAKKGREALEVRWDGSAAAPLASADISTTLRQAARAGKSVRTEGEPDRVAATAKRKLEAAYEVPYLAHATMEPLNCTVDIGPAGCEIWVGTQWPTDVQKHAAELTGLPLDQVKVHTTMLGGGFGRRAQRDFVDEAIHVAKAVGKPVKLVWTREDDTRAGYYRPVAYNEFTGAVDDDGWPNLWIHRISSPAVTQTLLPRKDGIDPTSIEGAANLPYAIDNLAITCAHPEIPITTWFWRSVGSSQNAYVTECFLDELAALGGKDPLEVRLRLLSDHPRHRRVTEIAADKAGWGKPLGAGRAYGLAVHEAFGSIVAEVAEVSIDTDHKGGISPVRVHRVVCAVDCGGVVNPDTVAAQMEGGIIFGLTAALYGKIDIKHGRAVQSNFHDYKMLRMLEAPKVETHIVAEGDPLGGIGEPGVPPIAPAVCNGLRALTGKPIRKLPVDKLT